MRASIINLIASIPMLSKETREEIALHMVTPDCFWSEEEKEAVTDALWETAKSKGEVQGD